MIPPARLLLTLVATGMMTSQGAQGQRRPSRGKPKPNIIVMMADDLGWADVQTHDPEMRTPSLQQLASRGLFLNQSYVLPTCAPTRSALLTGRYPFTYGMQVNSIKGLRLAWLNETLTLLPRTLGTLGYRTHMIGKWHLGFCAWSLTPTRRGFDTFYGFYSGAQGYFNHTGNNPNTYDFRDQDEVVWSAKGEYSTELYTARAQRIIREHGRRGNASATPFFLYLAYQNAHAPFEAKQSYVDKYCSHVTDDTRRIHCAMVAALDESIGNITKTLREEGELDKTVILFLSDNGGPTEGGAFNYPLRGKKATLWEGGTRSFTLFSAPTLSKKDQGKTYSGLVHAVDWFPTLVEAAGGSDNHTGADGLSMWSALTKLQPSPRTEFVYNIDDKSRRSALRWNNLKLTKGRPGRKFNGWYPPPSMGLPKKEVNKRKVDRWGLYDIEADPEERQNLFRDVSYRSAANEMRQKLDAYEARLWPWHLMPKEPRGNPSRYGGVYTPGWCTV